MNRPNHPPAIDTMTMCPAAADPEGYVQVVRTDQLPAAGEVSGGIVERGYATEIGSWYFFETLEPALTLGRVARTSRDCSGYGVFAAAVEQVFCVEHCNDERRLYYAGEELSRGPHPAVARRGRN